MGDLDQILKGSLRSNGGRDVTGAGWPTGAKHVCRASAAADCATMKPERMACGRQGCAPGTACRAPTKPDMNADRVPRMCAGRSMPRPYEVKGTAREGGGDQRPSSVRLGRRDSRAYYWNHPHCVAERVSDVGGHLIEVGDG